MSFREKSAWITLVTVVLVFSVYFGAILTGRVEGRSSQAVAWLAICVLGLVVVQIAFNLIAAATSPQDARAPRDEREQMIQARSHTIGYFTLIVLVLSLSVPAHIGHGVADLMQFALFDVAAAISVVAIAQVIMFRRGV